MADKLTQLIVDALTRAVAERDGLPLFAGKSDAGLFPATTVAKPAAKRCLDDRLLNERFVDGKGRQICTITETGMAYLREQVSPKQVLEDFVRVLESRQEQVEQLLTTARRMADEIAGLKAAVVAVLPGSRHEPQAVVSSNPRDLAARIRTHLLDWAAAIGAARDCPLPELYRGVSCGEPDLSVGAFHDVLRMMHAAGRVDLHPWTGPLYAVPEPGYALLVSHNVAYYASTRTG